MEKTTKDLILRAAQYLAGVCDFARNLDGQGYNAADTILGHSLAMASELEDDEAELAYSILCKYQRQLDAVGIILPQLPFVERNHSRAKERIIEKARAKLRGEMPDELMFCCGGDRAFLRKIDLHPADFLREVWAAGDDTQRVVRYVKSAAARAAGGANSKPEIRNKSGKL